MAEGHPLDFTGVDSAPLSVAAMLVYLLPAPRRSARVARCPLGQRYPEEIFGRNRRASVKKSNYFKYVTGQH